MAQPIFTHAAVLKHYDAARASLDPMAAVEHVAGLLHLATTDVEGIVQRREAVGSAAEAA